TVRRIQEFARRGERHAPAPVNLSEVIDGALEITRPRWHDLAQREGRPIRVRREIHHERLILGNAAELRELLINLIINAVDALPQGGELVLRLLEQPQEHGESSVGPYLRQFAIIEVIDNGVGVPPALRERIFESFYSTKPAGKGSGLGLAICRNIVARHGGRIELHSTVGQGSTFRVLLPIDDLSAPLIAAASTPAA